MKKEIITMIEKNKKLNPRNKEAQDKLIEPAKHKILNILKNKKKKKMNSLMIKIKNLLIKT